MSGTFIEFVEVTPTAKTRRFEVRNRRSGELLGRIGWFGRWRKYGFFPEPGMVFEEVCLGDIAEFCAARSQEHRDIITARTRERRAAQQAADAASHEVAE